MGRRALQSIPVEKESERLAIWNALLRIEVLFGSPESTEKLYKEALITNDHYKISEIMANIYESENKYQVRFLKFLSSVIFASNSFLNKITGKWKNR